MKSQRLVILGLLFGVAVAGACDDTTVDIPGDALAVSVTPASVTMNVGESTDISASVTGGEDGGDKTVTWTTSNASVASISATGPTVTVTGESAGPATITAIANADNAVRASATVTVQAAAEPSIVISSVTTAGGGPAPVNNIQGQINVTLGVDAPAGSQVSRVVLLVGGIEVYNQSFSGGNAELGDGELGVSTIQVGVLTDDYDPATGDVTWSNGPQGLRGELRGPGGEILTTTESEGTGTFSTLVFNNDNILAVQSLSTSGPSAIDDEGLLWNQGDLTVNVLDVVYDDDVVASVTVNLTEAGTTNVLKSLQVDESNSPWTAVFDSGDDDDDEVGDIEEPLGVLATSVTEAGQQGPSGSQGTTAGSQPAIRLDNLAPDTEGEIEIPAEQNMWVGPMVSPTSLMGDVDSEDDGVGGENKSVQWRPDGAGNSAWADVTNFANLDETQTNTAIDLRGRVCDDLNNCTTAGSIEAGVDKTPPTDVIYSSSPADMAILNGSESYALNGSDGLSGPLDFYGTLKRTNPNGSTSCAVGSGNSCNPVSSLDEGGTFDVSATTGYWTFLAVFRDQALNETAAPGREGVYDVTAPGMGNIVLPNTLPSGGNATFTSTATDNLDLASQVFRTIYNDGSELSYAGPTALGVFGGADLLQSSNLTATVPFIRAIEFTNGLVVGPELGALGVPAENSPTGVMIPATGARFSATDFGDNTSTASNNFAGGTVPAGTSATGLGVFDFVVETDEDVLCDDDATNCGNNDEEEAQLTGVVRGESGTFAAPFARVVFYRVVDGVHTFIGSTTSRSSTDTGVGGDADGRVWTYGPVILSGFGLSGDSPLSVVAVGVDSNGDALISQAIEIIVED